MSNLSHTLLIALVAASAPSATAQGDIITVGSTGDVTDVQSAIDLAVDGDHIVILESLIGTPTINGKSLTISGIDDTIALLSFGLFTLSGPALTIQNLAADQSVVVRQLTLDIQIVDPIPSLHIQDCAGPVHIEDCTIAGFNGAAITVEDCDAVSIASCSVTAGVAFDQGDVTPEYFPQAGLSAGDSRVSAYDSVFTGSSGPDASQIIFGPVVQPAPGGPGFVARENSVVYLSECTVTGGAGGSAGEGDLCFDGQDGGAGLVVDDFGAGSIVRLRNTGGGGGAGGTVPASCAGNPGSAGAPIEAAPGTVQALGDAARSLTTTSFVTEGDSVDLSFSVATGDFVSLLLGSDLGASLYLPASQLTLNLGLPLITIPLTTAPSEDPLEISITVPTLPIGFDVVDVPLQGLIIDTAMTPLATGPSVVTIYSAAGAP